MEIKEYVKLKKDRLQKQVLELDNPPHLVIIQVNDDPASNAYIKGKKKDLDYIKATYTLDKLSVDITEKKLIAVINKYNNDDSVDGILVQMPLPKHICEENIKNAVSPIKDVDGFHPCSINVPCTPKGILDYLKNEQVEMTGKNAVVIGRSNIVGKPMAKLLLKENCNVTVLHSKTTKEDLLFYLQHADIIVVAVGKKYFLKNVGLKKSAVVVDVGINRENDKLYGDVEPNLDVILQTPVPGGVGLLTRLAMLDNLMNCYRSRRSNHEF